MVLRIFGDRDAWVFLGGVSAWIAASQPTESASGRTRREMKAGCSTLENRGLSRHLGFRLVYSLTAVVA